MPRQYRYRLHYHDRDDVSNSWTTVYRAHSEEHARLKWEEGLAEDPYWTLTKVECLGPVDGDAR